MPYAKGVSAKSHDFDAAGNEVRDRLPQDDEDRARRRLPRLRRHRMGRRPPGEVEGVRLTSPTPQAGSGRTFLKSVSRGSVLNRKRTA